MRRYGSEVASHLLPTLAEIGQQKQSDPDIGVVFAEPSPLELAELAALTLWTLQSSFDWFGSQKEMRLDALYLRQTQWWLSTQHWAAMF